MTPLRTAAAIAANSPFTQQFTSPQTPYTHATDIIFAHGLGAMPELVQLTLVCVNNTLGYIAGQQIDMPMSTAPVNGGFGITAIKDATYVILRVGASGPIITRRDTSFQTSINPANWQMVLRAWA